MSVFGNAPASSTGNASTPNLFGTSSNTFGSSAAKPATNIFGATSAPTTTPSTSNLFGPTANTPAANTSSTQGPFGSFFGGAKPSQAQAPAKPEGGTTNTSSSIFPSSTNLFGSKPAESASTATSTTTNATNIFNSSLFGKPATTSTAATASTPVTGEKSAAPAPVGNAASTAGGSAPASGSGLTGRHTLHLDVAALNWTGGLFGSKPEDKKDTTTTPAPAGGLSLFGAPKSDEKTAQTGNATKPPAQQTSTLGALSTTSTTNTPVAVPPPSVLRGKTIEEVVNKWSSDLETHVTEFNKFAGEVAAWDRALIENGNNLAALYSHVLAVERDQNEVDQSLDHIEQQQKDLAATLDAYEKVTQEIFGGQGGGLRALDSGPADTERDKNYMLATDLHTHLEDLSASLTQMIDTVNSMSSPSSTDNSADEPMSQIAQILSSHLESLQWIDGAVRDVETKVSEVERRVKDSTVGQSATGQKRGFGLR